MKLFQTDRGLARQDGDRLGIPDIEETDLDAVLAAGRLDDMRDAATKEHVRQESVSFAPVVQRLMFGMAPGSATHAAGQPVQIPAGFGTEVDYEGEIGVVIGKTASQVKVADAWTVVAGLVPLNDVSARDVQAQGTLQAVGRAKGFPTFKPLGPCLATLDEFPDPLNIGLVTRVNGELRQQGRTIDMVFSIPRIIEIVTAKHTLEAGGVAHGGKHPYLKAGDTVEIEVEGLPSLTNTFRE